MSTFFCLFILAFIILVLALIPNAEARRRVQQFDRIADDHDRNLAISLLEESEVFKNLSDGTLREEMIQNVIAIIRKHGYGY